MRLAKAAELPELARAHAAEGFEACIKAGKAAEAAVHGDPADAVLGQQQPPAGLADPDLGNEVPEGVADGSAEVVREPGDAHAKRLGEFLIAEVPGVVAGDVAINPLDPVDARSVCHRGEIRAGEDRGLGLGKVAERFQQERHAGEIGCLAHLYHALDGLVTDPPGKGESAGGAIQQGADRRDFWELPKRGPEAFFTKLHHDAAGFSGLGETGVVRPIVREIAAEENQVAGFEVGHMISHPAAADAFEHAGQLDFWMIVPAGWEFIALELPRCRGSAGFGRDGL